MAAAATSAHGAYRRTRSANGGRAKKQSDHPNSKFEVSFHLTQWLGEDFDLPDRMDSVTFLQTAYLSKRKNMLYFLGRSEVPERNHKLPKVKPDQENALTDGKIKSADISSTFKPKFSKRKALIKMTATAKKLKIEEDDKKIENIDKGKEAIKKENRLKKTWRLSGDVLHAELDRMLILTRSRLFIVMERKEEDPNFKAGESRKEIIDSIPLHEIESIKYMMPSDEDKNVLKDYDGGILEPVEKYLCIFTVDNGFNAGNSFCFKTFSEVLPKTRKYPKSGDDMENVRYAIETAQKKWSKEFKKGQLLQDTQVCRKARFRKPSSCQADALERLRTRPHRRHGRRSLASRQELHHRPSKTQAHRSALTS